MSSISEEIVILLETVKEPPVGDVVYPCVY